MATRSEILAQAMKRHGAVEHTGAMTYETRVATPATKPTAPACAQHDTTFRGTVTKICGDRAFAFIRPDAPSMLDVFIPRSTVVGLNLQAGSRVAFNCVMNQKNNKMCASHVALIEEGQP